LKRVSQAKGTSLLKHAHNIHKGQHKHHHKRHFVREPTEESIREKREAAEAAKGELQNTMHETVSHLKDASSLRYEMVKKERQLGKENAKLKALDSNEKRLEETHDSLVSSLHRMIVPKLMSANKRLEKKEEMYQKEQEASKAWREKRDVLKRTAMELVEKKEQSYKAMLEAEAEAAKWQKKAELARMQYEHDRVRTADQVQQYKYAETRFNAELEHENKAKEAAMQARETVERLHEAEHSEEKKVDEAISMRRNKLQRKINKVEAAREKDSSTLNKLEDKYREWKHDQHERTEKVLENRHTVDQTSAAYAEEKRQEKEAAMKKKFAAAADDWDGWGSAFSNVNDEETD